MVNSADTSSPSTAVDLRWLWVVRIAAVAAIVVRLLQVLGRFGGGDVFADLVLSAPPLILFSLVLWRLRLQTLKPGLALAVSTGSIVCALGALGFLVHLVVFSSLRDASTAGIANWQSFSAGFFFLTQALLVASAIRTYYTMRREPGDGHTLAWGFVTSGLILFGGHLLSLLVVFHWGRVGAG